MPGTFWPGNVVQKCIGVEWRFLRFSAFPGPTWRMLECSVRAKRVLRWAAEYLPPGLYLYGSQYVRIMLRNRARRSLVCSRLLLLSDNSVVFDRGYVRP